MGLTAVTALGDNAVAMLGAITAELRRLGLDVDGRERAAPSSTSARALLETASLGWACGLLTADLVMAGSLAAEVVAAPVFEGQTAPMYHSVIVARRTEHGSALDDRLRGRLVVNEAESWSGHYALVAHLADHGRPIDSFSSVELSGSHRGSIEAILANEADVAAVDHTVWQSLAGSGAISDVIEVVDRTQDWPAPPFIVGTRLGDRERSQLVAALLEIGDHRVPGLVRIMPADLETYEILRSRRSSLPRLL